MPGHEQEIRRLRRRLHARLALRNAVRFSVGWIMAWGLAAVVLRAGAGVDRAALAWGAAGLAPAVLIALLRAARAVPAESALRALLDRHGRLGGLLMAEGDGPIGAWDGRIAAVPVPEVAWRFGRQWGVLTAAVALLAAGFLIPDRYLPASQSAELQIDAELQKLAEKIDVLKQEQVLPPEKADARQAELDAIRQQASGADPAKTLEAIDHLQQSFAKAAAEEKEGLFQRAQKAAAVEALAAALGDARDPASPAGREAAKELAAALKEAAAGDPALAQALSEELKAACESGELSPDQLGKAAEALRCAKDARLKGLEKLVKGRLVDCAELAKLAEIQRLDGAELKRLVECQGGNAKDANDAEDALAIAVDKAGEGGGDAAALNALNLPGRGGINRGRGDAAMTWKNGAETENVAFKPSVLPLDKVAALKRSRLEGLSRAAPTVEPGGASAGGNLGAAAGPGAASGQRILPEHAKPVQRYFEREK